ncbi:MAG: type II toxin-antitoxin system death-on-curing family toxin [Bryobacteraceae bacterium]|nr:type II toxin-antitoxin system death-on-curing family toxin [Bryobacteraceae bacterium]
MAAAYLFHLCQNHVFLDGNKRIGANAALVFLYLNDWELSLSQMELVDLVLGVASGLIAQAKLAAILTDRCSPR